LIITNRAAHVRLQKKGKSPYGAPCVRGEIKGENAATSPDSIAAFLAIERKNMYMFVKVL
jgi:hypothetical protein